MSARCECAAVTGNRRCLSEKQSIETSRVLQRRDVRKRTQVGVKGGGELMRDTIRIATLDE